KNSEFRSKGVNPSEASRNEHNPSLTDKIGKKRAGIELFNGEIATNGRK
ncbi:hypothetical protein MNBD_GAMMA04-257, partial [hydrothermal vent metagenome]